MLAVHRDPDGSLDRLKQLGDLFDRIVATWGRDPQFTVDQFCPSNSDNAPFVRWYGRLERQSASQADIRRQIDSVRRRLADRRLELQLPLLDRMYKEYAPGDAPDVLEQIAALYRRADGFIVVSGEYNHGIPPALKNLLDHFLEEYFWRPSGIVCYSAGVFGGVRAAMQLRAMLCELGTPSIPSLLPIPRIQDAFDDDGRPLDQEGLAVQRRQGPSRARNTTDQMSHDGDQAPRIRTAAAAIP